MIMSTMKRWNNIAVVMVGVLLMVIPTAAAFGLVMDYKPPVQSSVSKISRSSRFSQPDYSVSSSSRPRTSKEAAATASISPLQEVTSSSSRDSSFASRMRDLALGNQNARRAAAETETKTKRILPPNVQTVESLRDYKLVVGDERNKVVIVRFYAPWCKACKAVAPFFYRLATTFPNIVFVDVPVTDKNTNLHQGLGVTSLPFGHIYHPDGGLVEEIRMTRKHIPLIAQKLQSYISGRCDLSEPGNASCPYPELE